MANAEQQLYQVEQLIQQGQVGEAASVCQKIIEAFPRNAKAFNYLGSIAFMANQKELAIRYLEQAVENDPNQVDYIIHLSKAYLSEHNEAKAAEVVQNFILDPGDMAARQKLLPLLQQLHTLLPDNKPLFILLSQVYIDDGKLQDAISIARHMLATTKPFPQIYSSLAFALERTNDVEEALQVIDQGLELFPDNPLLSLNKGNLEQRKGNLEVAQACFHIAADSASLGSINRGIAYNGLAKILDKQGKEKEAYEAFAKAKKIHSQKEAGIKGLELNNVYVPEVFNIVKNYFTPDRVDGWKEKAKDKSNNSQTAELDKAIFLVGFPRSGTTLLEQMFSAHPNVLATEEEPLIDRMLFNIPMIIQQPFTYPDQLHELEQEHIERLQQTYWNSLAQLFGQDMHMGSTKVLDKNPLNLAFLGLLNRIFPQGKILVLLRDPRDAVLSCLMQLFKPHTVIGQKQSIEEIVQLYASLFDLYLHYKSVLSIDIFEVTYESLIEDTEKILKEASAFIDLPWDDAMLHYYKEDHKRVVTTPSYEGVMQPVYNTASQRWKRYEKQLEPVMDILQPYVKAFGYDG